MNCPSCGGPITLEADDDYLRCNFCGEVHFPDADPDGVRVLGEEARESCPLCAVRLVHAAIARHRIRFCPHCRGMLVLIDDFVFIVDDLRTMRGTSSAPARPPDPKSLERHIDCPVCHRQMDTHPYCGPGNIVLDTCEQCGVHWLDHSEIDRVARAPDQHYTEGA